MTTQEQAFIDAWRASGETIVFTNGVFDILHAGHVTYLQAARALGGKLVVGLNSVSYTHLTLPTILRV